MHSLPVQAGFHDTREEDVRAREIGKEFRPTTVDQIENKMGKVCPRPCIALALRMHATLEDLSTGIRLRARDALVEYILVLTVRSQNRRRQVSVAQLSHKRSS